ncbi:MAG: 3-isopropylmalate dehydratase large subunit [Candidatus Peregrinibacteria bacterium]|nr:3-isopropylmalate dehydratase large subunit [Candidatus Peregrinibacteria bacterium]
MARNIIQKIWDEHVVVSKEGFPDVFAIDLHLIHEVTSPQAFEMLREKGLKFHASDRAVATVDHNVSTAVNRKIATDAGSQKQIMTLRKNCEEFGVKLIDMDSGRQGIVHVIGPELGLTQPGITVVCGDSHTSTHGAFGALAFGIGTTEVGHVMATGCLLQEKPKTMKVNFIGKIGECVTAKDLILKLISQIGVAGARGHVIEYTGEVVRKMSMDERMTICNMSIECGARAGLIAPDEVTFEYLKGRECAPKGEKWAQALQYWSSLVSDVDAEYDNVVEVNVDEMAPMVTWGFNPGQGIEVSEVIPENADVQALDYVRLEAGQKIEGVPVNYVFIGSCTNARLSDLREAARIFKGRKVADGVIVYVVPGSESVREAAIKEGLDKVFTDAGADFRNPGCSMCLAMNEDKVPEGKRCASTSNRNFVGRQGKGAITHLMSPIMAAAAAVTGKITDVRKLI